MRCLPVDLWQVYLVVPMEPRAPARKADDAGIVPAAPLLLPSFPINCYHEIRSKDIRGMSIRNQWGACCRSATREAVKLSAWFWQKRTKWPTHSLSETPQSAISSPRGTRAGHKLDHLLAAGAG